MNRTVPPLAPGDPVREAARRLAEYRVRGIPVVHDRRVLGIVTEKNIMEVLKTGMGVGDDFILPSPFEIVEYIVRRLDSKLSELKERDVGSMPVQRIMEHQVIVVDPDVPIEDAAALLATSGDEVLLVVSKKDGYLGVVSEGDIVHGLAKA